ncbi:hypothetical protein CMO86_09920 [Candidatus Woesearchaeota archaeon]|jgi:hypothetical protein|nr:hypothetical protein [Candidatus Woesearchaeota archaeon]|tara:strand:- start:3194 stop:3871 length:678 start_codon:yes stop_codon:yes gene_type:complete
MAKKTYFRKLPNFEYQSLQNDRKLIQDFDVVKNIFKKGRIRPDIFNNINFFNKYIITANKRPDQVAYEIYEDADLDWVVLMANNIVNVQNEWPLSEESYNEYLLDKYGSYQNLYNIHHYETREVRDSQNRIIVQGGLKVQSPYPVTFYDDKTDREVSINDIAIAVTNNDFEQRVQNDKSRIYVLKPDYLQLVLNDMELIMMYKKGSSDYVTRSLKKTQPIRLYQD